MADESIPYRTCIACGLTKPNAAYAKLSNPSSRLGNKCSACRSRINRGTMLPPLLPSRGYCPAIEKRCVRCKEIKSRADFRRCGSARDGLESWCKVCTRANRREYSKTPIGIATRRRGVAKYGKTIKGRMATRKAWLKKHYGLTWEDYEAILISQDGVCAICKKPPPHGKRLVVDHDHRTGTVRGLLCRLHNSALGLLGDTLESVEAAKEYLEEARARHSLPSP